MIVGVLAILIFSYRQTIMAYPSAGGAYIVTKDNFGLLPAQVAGVALLTDYVLTVAVSVSSAAGAAPLRDAVADGSPLGVWEGDGLGVGDVVSLGEGVGVGDRREEEVQLLRLVRAVGVHHPDRPRPP